MKKVRHILLSTLTLLAMLLMFSCNSMTDPAESKTGSFDTNLLSKVQKELAENTAEEIVEDITIEEIIDEVLMDLEDYDFLKSESTCPVITRVKPEDAKYPRVITKDFGDGCVTNSGVEKSGKIIITLYGPWLQEGTKRIINFEEYTHRGIAVSGEKEIICKGLNEDSLYMHVVKGELVLVKPDSVIVKRKIYKKRVLLAGAGNPDVPKEWLVIGHVKVEKSNGISFEVHTKTPLYRIQGCRWYQDGIKVIIFGTDKEDDGDKEGDGDKVDDGKTGWEGKTGSDGKEDSDQSKHIVVIDYGYAESEDACDSFVLRSINGEEAEVVNLRR